VLGEASKEEKIQVAQIFGVSGDADTVKYLERAAGGSERGTCATTRSGRSMRTLRKPDRALKLWTFCRFLAHPDEAGGLLGGSSRC